MVPSCQITIAPILSEVDALIFGVDGVTKCKKFGCSDKHAPLSLLDATLGAKWDIHHQPHLVRYVTRLDVRVKQEVMVVTTYFANFHG